MAGSRRIPREKATAALTALLERICAGGAHADCVTAVYVFGSYARGALTVGDVDMDIEYDAKLHPAVERELMDNLVVGRDWNTPLRKALKPARALQVMFSRLEMIAEPVLVYERGDALDRALARIDSIAPDAEAGRADRDPVHPAIEPIADDLARPIRILLSELLAGGLLDLEIIDLADAEEDELSDESFVFETRLRWRSAASPLARAARAAGAHLQASGVDLDGVALMPGSVLDQSGGAVGRSTAARRTCGASWSTWARTASAMRCSCCILNASARCARCGSPLPTRRRCRTAISTPGCRNARRRFVTETWLEVGPACRRTGASA